MRKYAFSDSTAVYFDSYDLRLRDDGTFEWSVGFSDPAGAAGGYGSTGRWKQTGDLITFEIFEYNDEPKGSCHPTTAVLHADRLDVAGVGTFWLKS